VLPALLRRQDGEFSRALSDSEGAINDTRTDRAANDDDQVTSDRPQEASDEIDAEETLSGDTEQEETARPDPLNLLALQDSVSLTVASALGEGQDRIQGLIEGTPEATPLGALGEEALLNSSALTGLIPTVATSEQAGLSQTTSLANIGTIGQNIANLQAGANTVVQASALTGNGLTQGAATPDGLFETTLASQAGSNNTASTAAQNALNNQTANLAQATAVPTAQTTDPTTIAQQSANPALNNLAGEQNSTTNATPSQQLASLLSGASTEGSATPSQLASLTQPASAPLQQTAQPVLQQANQPLAQFANASFANETLPAFTAQISRNFAAGQDQFNVRLNPSELGVVLLPMKTAA